jgi:hypothetical protein
MGGQAFPGLHVPRMSPQIYQQVKATTLQVISKHYPNTATMYDAPGKLDYGDVDLVVELPSSDSFATQQIALDLHAERIKQDNPPSYCFAVPLPDSTTGLEAFAQVDVLTCPTDHLQWTLFLHGYGDLGSILGTMNYGYGFTSKNDGFFVRIKEQETHNWSASHVFLSKDPSEVMGFLCLSKQEYDRGFQTEKQLFDWAAACRLFDYKLIVSRNDTPEMRSRLEKRSMFRRFITEYLPTLKLDNAQSIETRDTLTNSALLYFGKQEEFEKRRARVLVENAEDHAWLIITTTVLKPLVHLEGKRLNEVVRAFKRFTAFKEGQPYISDHPEMDAHRQARFAHVINHEDEVLPAMRDWMVSHWEGLRCRERQRVKDSKGTLVQMV